MEPYADVTCILSMNVECQACKMQVLEVLSSIIGVYSVGIDADKGRVKISGEVDPNVLLKALARSGKHAKLAWAKLNHPTVHRSYHGDPHAFYNYGYGALQDPYHGRRYRRTSALPGWNSAHDYPSYRTTYFPGAVPLSRFRPCHF